MDGTHVILWSVSPASVALDGMEWIFIPLAGWDMGVGRGAPQRENIIDTIIGIAHDNMILVQMYFNFLVTFFFLFSIFLFFSFIFCCIPIIADYLLIF